MNEKTDSWDNLFASLPVDTAIREDHRQDLEGRVLDAFDTAAAKNERAASRSTKQRLMQSRVLRLAIAASLLIALAFAFSVGNRPAFALEALVDKIVNASSARWDMILQRQGMEDHRITFSLTPNGYRMESDLQITIVNWDTGKGLGLFPQLKNAVVLPVPKQPIAEINQFLKIQDGLREAMLDPEQNVDSLGEQTFGKKTLTGFRFHSSGQLIDVWADPSTQFPERIEISIAGGDKAVLLNYETDIEQDETRLSTIVPDGYRLVPGDDDLISTLRISCELSGGVFPPNLSTEGIGELSSQFLTELTKSRGTNKENEIVEELLEFQRGFAYLILLASERNSDVHYAGSGVRFNAVDSPILWYKPKGSEHYRVIDATLAVTEQINAPEIPVAMKL